MRHLIGLLIVVAIFYVLRKIANNSKPIIKDNFNILNYSWAAKIITILLLFFGPIRIFTYTPHHHFTQTGLMHFRIHYLIYWYLLCLFVVLEVFNRKIMFNSNEIISCSAFWRKKKININEINKFNYSKNLLRYKIVSNKIKIVYYGFLNGYKYLENHIKETIKSC